MLNKNRAYTLAEVVVTLGIVSILFVVLIPILKNKSPKANKVFIKKSYSTAQKIIYDMINNDKAYPDAELGFADVTDYESVLGGNNKFCYYFIKSMNTVDEDISNCKATSSDGISWSISNSSDSTPTTISVDVNGLRDPNCSSSTCSNPDKYSFSVDSDGRMNLDDDYVQSLLKNPTVNN